MTEQVLEIQRIYTKDVSVEVPGAPAVFLKEWRPEMAVDLGVKRENLDNDIYEVSLSVTVTAKLDGEAALLVEVHQAGIFHIKGFDEQELDHILRAYCANLLFPYARERVSSAFLQASFPQMNLNPVNFDALYAEQKKTEDAS